MRDWNDTQSVPCAVVRVTAQKMKAQALRLTGSALTLIKPI